VVACILSFSAGALTVLSPCVLPLALIAMTSALQRHRLGPVALAGGLAVSSTILGLLFAMLGFTIDRDVVRLVAALVLVVLGIVLLSLRAQGTFARMTAPVSDGAGRLLARMPRGGVLGQFAVGALLGAIWTPCAGPTLAAAITLAAQRTSVPSAAVVIAAFSVGAAVPLVALAYVSREALGRRAESIGRIARPLTGVALVVVGILTLSGGDRVIETRLVDVMPGWLMDLTTRF
jgi:cytochrome c biogenesis protein CcdA